MLSKETESRIIEMAWEDRTPFEAIELQFGLSFKLWRTRVSGRSTKHVKLRSSDVSRGYCPTQYKHR
ncbi:TIGR03643 family protein [Vibrio tasmaniensis]|uniref:TIGR03643 family protein n=1 Tax=Vibrio tasmaniensis TaxID=212663 RepID=UPI001080A1EA|nr:TIGR03643 family protein [Vibrio tasmaniensis]